ncbi:hypothetical protein [Parvibaculum sp.]|uniref:hypothetical protein n=1 Tax=Parvibaculum sp. TaxID=2024848 RepID=UPI0027334076|nr:hypothetical protein [Parvibaculum sp.]MDP3327202.1 hypothetical protein [Parvibaculum sp.]
MAKNQGNTAPATVETPASAPETFPKTVDEFCAELSVSEKRVELIYAFSQDEKNNGRVKDMAENYRSRFEAFATKPV